MKTCAKCGLEKDLDAFDRHPSGKHGRHPRCKEWRKSEHKDYYENNKEKWVEREAAMRAADPEALKKKNRDAATRYRANPNNTIYARHLMDKYGITVEQFEAMEKSQDGKCAICGGPPRGRAGKKGKRFHVDHDHKTRKVRALLCFNCNAMLGNCFDEVEILEKAIAYLHSHEPQPL